MQAEVDRGALNAKLWKLFLDRRLQDLFVSETGFVARPTGPLMPS